MGVLSTIINRILDVIFPTRCISCGESGDFLCVRCLTESREAERESASWIFPLFDYRHPPIKKAIWLLKYKGKVGLADTFGDVLCARILEELSELSIMENFRDAILVPIPLSPKRHKERGFNQAELIAQRLTEINPENFTLVKDVLIKPKDTEHQAHITNRAKRMRNIVGSFSVRNEERIKNRNIILIDDVTTTGATLNEARKVLKQAGAKKIIAFTVAH